MLRIENIRKVINIKVFANWVIRDINNHPTQGKYMFDIHCISPLGIVMDRCTISLERHGKMLKTMTHPTTRSYFFYYNGVETNVCGGADWLADMDNFTAQLEYIITKYHNKQ
jgi:hypothetical protein